MGHQLVFQRADENDPDGTIETTEFIWRVGAHGYLLNLIAEKTAHDKYIADLVRLLESFETLESQ